MSQEPSAEAFEAAKPVVDYFYRCFGDDPETRDKALLDFTACALDAFAAQAVAAHAHEPDEAMVAEALYQSDRSVAPLWQWGDQAEVAFPLLLKDCHPTSQTEYHRRAAAALAAIGPGRSDRDEIQIALTALHKIWRLQNANDGFEAIKIAAEALHHLGEAKVVPAPPPPTGA